MTYRFAFAAFWAAVAVANVSLSPPLDHPGVVKGLLLRHLRWWARQADIFNTGGTFNIGYAYPNMFMSEDYNSPQSVYWCLKSFIVLELPEDSTFWMIEEQPHPLSRQHNLHQIELIPRICIVGPPKHIICSTDEHHFLLSSGQMTNKNHRAREAKYGKMAYSSAFAFSVPTGPLLEQMAPDSTLSASVDEGETWRVRCEPYNVKFDSIQVIDESGEPVCELASISSVWKPWKQFDLEIETSLIAAVDAWPGWHLRVHKISWDIESASAFRIKDLRLVDGGFATSRVTPKGHELTEVHNGQSLMPDCWRIDGTECLVLSNGGASGAASLAHLSPTSPDVTTEAIVLRPDANTNLIYQRTFIPALRYSIILDRGERSDRTTPRAELILATGIMAISPSAELGISKIDGLWSRTPRFKITDDKSGKPIIVIRSDKV
jgi:hypothetical protein